MGKDARDSLAHIGKEARDSLVARSGRKHTKNIGWAPYFVSALASKADLAESNMIMAALDVIAHVSIWIIALIFEAMVFSEADNMRKANPSDTRTWPFATASLVMFIIPASVIIISFVAHIFNIVESTPDSFLPFLTAVVEGGLQVSILFTLVCMLYTVGVNTATPAWRDYTITLLVMKTMAASLVNANVRRSLNMNHHNEHQGDSPL